MRQDLSAAEHLNPAEPYVDAALRGLREELGVQADDALRASLREVCASLQLPSLYAQPAVTHTHDLGSLSEGSLVCYRGTNSIVLQSQYERVVGSALRYFAARIVGGPLQAYDDDVGV
jgi:hypothetical protein